APRVSDGQGDPQGENALVEALSGLFEKSLAEAAAEAVEGEVPSPSSRQSQESLKSLAEVANKNEQPRGKTSPKSTPGSFASADDASGAPAGKPKEDKGQQISQERAAILSGKLRVISPSEAHVLLSEPVTVKNPTGAEFRFTKEKLLSDNSHLKKDHSNADFHRREKVMLYAIDAAKTSRDITNSRSSQPNEHGVYVQRKEVRKKYTDPKTKKQFEVVVRADNNGEVYEAFDVFPR
ncbi:MAG: hypothetical protein II391_03520, partial [Kiritimatiellae bacterium]|nr:hypothetical protein [Kiritimatiellia bacterium]